MTRYFKSKRWKTTTGFIVLNRRTGARRYFKHYEKRTGPGAPWQLIQSSTYEPQQS